MSQRRAVYIGIAFLLVVGLLLFAFDRPSPEVAIPSPAAVAPLPKQEAAPAVDPTLLALHAETVGVVPPATSTVAPTPAPTVTVPTHAKAKHRVRSGEAAAYAKAAFNAKRARCLRDSVDFKIELDKKVGYIQDGGNPLKVPGLCIDNNSMFWPE